MAEDQLYQLEVKLGLAQFIFESSAGWHVTVHVDPMELAKGARHPRGKTKRAGDAARKLAALGVTIGEHKLYGRVDVVAEHHREGLRLIEVEGESKRQREQALYSSLGQLLLVMKNFSNGVGYGIAVPNTREWIAQLRKIPVEVTSRLSLTRYLIGPNSATTIEPGLPIPDWSRG